ncbi:MAG: nucleotidyltransferase domain-containing protein [Gaiellaceae bacterium]
MLARLRAAGIHVWIEGGWGVDALLGEQTRPHDDLDLGVRFEDVEPICEALAEFERSDDEWPSSFVLSDVSGRKVDCHPLRFDENGDGWQSNHSGGPPYRWSREGLVGAGRIDGLEVTCITPELQVRWHMHPEFDDVDWADMQRLSGRFGLELPAACVERPGFIAPKRAADAM